MIDLLYFENGLKKAKLADLNKVRDKQIWIDITAMTTEEKDIIQKAFDLHPLTSEDLFNSNIRIKVEEFPNYLLSVFYGIEKTKSIELLELVVKSTDFSARPEIEILPTPGRVFDKANAVILPRDFPLRTTLTIPVGPKGLSKYQISLKFTSTMLMVSLSTA